MHFHIAHIEQHFGCLGQGRGLRMARPVRLVDAWHRIQQHLGVGVLRCIKNRVHRPGFHNLAPAHHLHMISKPGNHAHIMRNNGNGRFRLGGQIAHNVQNLRLHRHIQRRSRLIGDQKIRPAQGRHRNHHPLAHPTGKLMRILPHPLLGLGNTHELQRRQHAPLGLRRFHALMHLQGLHQLRANFQMRRQ